MGLGDPFNVGETPIQPLPDGIDILVRVLIATVADLFRLVIRPSCIILKYCCRDLLTPSNMHETPLNANANTDNRAQYFIWRSILFSLLAVCICTTVSIQHRLVAHSHERILACPLLVFCPLTGRLIACLLPLYVPRLRNRVILSTISLLLSFSIFMVLSSAVRSKTF